MLVNREVKLWILSALAVLLSGVVLMLLIPRVSVGIFAIVWVGLLELVFFYWFIRRHYKKISELSDYLSRISNGECQLDIRDNEEGELSLLKNEIYKVTLMLAEQAELLTKDKIYLADSIADISHQLKTPLTSMMVMSDLLSDGELPDDKRREFTSMIRAQLERIEWLVSSLLKLSKLDAGTIHMKKEPVLVRDLVKEAAEPLLIPLELKNIEIREKGEAGAQFIGDFEWTKEALTNLIKNGMEHSPADSALHISYGENAIYTSIAVTDEGEGIDRRDLPHIFERFYRGKNAGKDSVGIGLAMAKNILLNQGGTIEVEGETGAGTTFRIKIYKGVI